jgi:peptidoglycan/xylan/chitin deacetylase (PgdA/CDA1 family)
MVWHTVPRSVQLLLPKRMWEGDAVGSRVHLTFDDGPVAGVTDYVLNELAKRNQKATFFMVGDNIRKNPELAAEVLKSGHGIGNHTFNHLNGWKTPNAEYLENIQACDRILEEKLGAGTLFYRPPYGMVKSSQAKTILRSKKIVMWNVLSGDYDRKISSSRILEKTKKYTRSGSIVLFHDQQKTREVLPEFLPQFLDFLIERGLETTLL